MSKSKLAIIIITVTILLTALSTWSEYYGYQKAKAECKQGE